MSARFGVAVLLASIFASGPGCGDDGPPPMGDRPAAPDENDPAFDIDGLQRWYLVGNELTPGEDTLTVIVNAPAEVEYVDVWIGDELSARLDPQGVNDHGIALDLTDLPPGDHDVLFAADGADTAFAHHVLHRSHPLYVMVTTDWDFADPSTQALQRQDRLHEMHPGMMMTHFVGPYTFTDPELTDERREELAAWVIAQRDTFGDEIGLHIHPYCNFVTDAGLECITDQSTVYAEGDESGYTIKVSAYGEEGFLQLLQHADTIFAEWDLGKPVTFRAGGWTASIETLRALEADGFVADTSANNWMRMEEWIGIENGELYNWNMLNWASIGDTSQPYYPNDGEILSDASPNLGILEVPDNSIMVDYVSVEEMVQIFDANWPGGALAAPTSFMMGFHPASGFAAGEEARVDGILDYAEQFLAENDRGPVVHALLRDMPLVFRE